MSTLRSEREGVLERGGAAAGSRGSPSWRPCKPGSSSWRGRARSHDDANWAGLVKVYETMKPRDAAAIFNDMDLPVLLQVLDRMKEAKSRPDPRRDAAGPGAPGHGPARGPAHPRHDRPGHAG